MKKLLFITVLMVIFITGALSEQTDGGSSMAAHYRENILNVELENGSLHRGFLRHTIGKGDVLADRFGVRVFRNGEQVQLSGSCNGYFIRADGETVPVTNGVISGNVAYVTLTEECYAVEGIFSLAIKIASGGETVTMRIVDGMVSRTSTDVIVDPGTIIPSVEALIELIDEAERSIPQEYSAVNKAIRIDAMGIMSESLTFEQGGINGDTGAFVTSNIQIRTGFIYVGKGNTLKLTLTDGYKGHVRWYNGASATTFVSGRNSVSGYITAPADFVALLVTEAGWGNIVPSEGSHMTAKVISADKIQEGSVKTAHIVSSQPIEFDTYTWKLKLPGSSYYCRLVTSFGEKININDLGEVTLSGSCVVYYKRDTHQIIAGDFFANVDDVNLYYLGIINGARMVSFNVDSEMIINGVSSTGNAPEFRRLYGYRYGTAYISILGDSISTYNGYSEGAYYPTGDVDTVGETWWAIVAKGLRAPLNDVTVSAISRTSYIDQNDPNLPPAYDTDRINRLGSVHYPSYIFVNMGTNDPYLNNLGDMTYESDITALNALPNSTTKGIALTIRKLQNIYQDSRIVLLIPKPVKIDTVHGTSPQYTAELVEKVAERIKALGELYGVFKVIDLRKCDINQSNVASYCGDGAIHPNASGMKRMGEYILYEMMK